MTFPTKYNEFRWHNYNSILAVLDFVTSMSLVVLFKTIIIRLVKVHVVVFIELGGCWHTIVRNSHLEQNTKPKM